MYGSDAFHDASVTRDAPSHVVLHPPGHEHRRIRLCNLWESMPIGSESAEATRLRSLGTMTSSPTGGNAPKLSSTGKPLARKAF